jgi:cellulose biosynthesis protein BcsQ
MKIILIANLAGGVGKTTLAHSIATAASEYGKKTLAIDADPDASLTFLAGIENPRLTLAEVANEPGKNEAAIVKTIDRFSLIPSASRLIELERISDKFKEAISGYELVIIDSPSGPNRILPQLLSLADRVLAPIDGSMLSIRGALHIRRFIGSENKLRINLITNKKVNDFGLNQIKSDLDFVETEIRFDEKVHLAQFANRSVLTTYPDSDFASDVRELTYSLLEDFSLI